MKTILLITIISTLITFLFYCIISYLEKKREKKQEKKLPKAPPLPAAIPYVIYIENKTTAPVVDFTFFTPDLLVTLNWDEKGNYTKDGIIVSNSESDSTATITFQQLLLRFLANKADIGLTYFQTTAPNQILTKMSIISRNVNKPFESRPIDFAIDPYQFNSNCLVLHDKYTLDANTALQFEKILPGAKIKMQFYPIEPTSQIPLIIKPQYPPVKFAKIKKISWLKRNLSKLKNFFKPSKQKHQNPFQID